MDLDQKVMRAFWDKRFLKWAVVLAIFVFLGRMVWENWAQVKEASFTFRLLPLIFSVIIFAFSYFIQIWAWYLITLKLGIALSIRETFECWFTSQLGKYLPGKVWLFLGRFYLYESKGKSKKLISTALYFEMMTIVLAGGVIFLASLFLLKEGPLFFRGEPIGWIIFLFLMILLFLHPRFLQKLINGFLIRFKRETIQLSVPYSDILGIVVLCIFAWLIGGIGFYLFVSSIISIPSAHFLFLTGALAISSILGLIAFFAPAGLGVREGALVYFLSFVLIPPVAVIVSILSRIWMTLIEIGMIGMVYLIPRFQDWSKRRR